MSTKTESTETAMTVPSICLPPPSPLRAWLCSYSEKIAPKDSPLSGAASNSELSGCGLGMRTQAYEQLIPLRISLPVEGTHFTGLAEPHRNKAGCPRFAYLPRLAVGAYLG